MSLFWLLVGVDKGRDVCTSLDYRSTGWQATNNIPLSTPPSPLPELSSDLNCVLRSRSWFPKDPKHLSCQITLSFIFLPRWSSFILSPSAGSSPIWVHYISFHCFSLVPSFLPPSPPVSIKLPFPVPLRTRGRVVYLGVAPPAIDSCDMNNTLLTKLHHSAHRPDTTCFYFCEFS